SFNVSLSFALIATISILIIVVVVAVVVVAVVIVAVVVAVVIGSICRSASTILGQMANLFAVIVPRWTRTFMIVITLGTQRFRPGVWFPVTIACSVGMAYVLPLILLLLVLIVLGKIIILSFHFY
ncbi:hypothetical protein Tco_0243574, partial [Tanacetum coccineum]